MVMDDYDGQMIFEELMGLKLPDIRLTGEEKPRKKNLTQETCPDRRSNPGPLRDKRACYHLKCNWKVENVVEVQRRRRVEFGTAPPTRVKITKIQHKFEVDGTEQNVERSVRKKELPLITSVLMQSCRFLHDAQRSH